MGSASVPHGMCSPGAFVKYEKMGDNSGSVGASAGISFKDAYVVTEKVHGANFCIIASKLNDSISVKFANRTAIVGSMDEAENFYSCRSTGLLRRLTPCGAAVLEKLADNYSDDSPVHAVHIYGELFGGSYPHPDVEAIPGMEPVQIGVWYAPDLHFMAFDVVAETCSGRSYLPYDNARNLCVQCGLMFAEPLFRGTLAQCLDFKIEFTTTIPGRLGLPAIPLDVDGTESNLAEGCVVRPEMEPTCRLSGVRAGKESMRGLFKRKISQFSEKRYQNDDWQRGKNGGGGEGFSLTAEELARIEIAALITEQRLDNVLSKVGRVNVRDQKACRQLLEDFKQDVRESLEEADLGVLTGSVGLETDLDGMSKDLIKHRLLARR
eukprot:TRINITY_DN102874_c0_g1_i1.p1 TRINITY_DN102874_c0_g1~~TRINITY_DN102874_c0_g1_i1.p1  ORF type:complete len:379 (-),score=66.83 TRINITY_DN102874_c0_g1_i1:87-1223(-)